ncbi:MAG: putative metallo-hydrolase YycJ [Chlamydiae bacterium]|nr:putative metallo-hydrolase YycJ [Chlamydiota bacterium]
MNRKPGYCPLASGSKGNALYFESGKTKILVDAGISGLQTKKRLAELGVGIEEISAILITHDHTDHIQGLRTLAFRHNIPVLANSETAKGIYQTFGACPKFKIFTTGESFTYEDLEIHPYSIPHDTSDPVAFTIRTGGIQVGICTDLGYVTSTVRSQLQNLDYLVLESNHEPSMVHACPRPMVYKQRVLGRSGHLSNEACASLVEEILHDGLKHIHLAHLSQECNAPQTALETVKNKIGEATCLAIAPQEKIGEYVTF